LNTQGLQKVITGLALAAIISGCANHKAVDGDINAGKTLATQGKGAIPACVACHGANGEGNAQTGYPRLAGLNYGYLAKEMRDMARELPHGGVVLDPIQHDYSATPRVYSDLTSFTPGVRQDQIMSGIAKQLTETDIKNLSAYYSSLGFKATPVSAQFQTLERGQDLALRGKPEYGLPGCVSCHAPDGEGFGADFPPLAGQPVQYIINQINHWQRGERDNDPQGMMRAVSEQLTDADKINVATYYANRSLTVKGN
jgi:cytochrome c553